MPCTFVVTKGAAVMIVGRNEARLNEALKTLSADGGKAAALNLAIRPETYQRVKTQGIRLRMSPPRNARASVVARLEAAAPPDLRYDRQAVIARLRAEVDTLAEKLTSLPPLGLAHRPAAKLDALVVRVAREAIGQLVRARRRVGHALAGPQRDRHVGELLP